MMGDLDPGVLWELAMGRHEAYLRQAETDRVSKRLHRPAPSLRERVTVAVGDHLITLGLSLKRQYDPQPSPGHLYGRSGP